MEGTPPGSDPGSVQARSRLESGRFPVSFRSDFSQFQDSGQICQIPDRFWQILADLSDSCSFPAGFRQQCHDSGRFPAGFRLLSYV